MITSFCTWYGCMQNTVTTVNLQGREHWGKMRKEYNKMWPIKTDVRKMHWGWKKKSENESDICICWDVKRNLTIFNNYFWHFFFFFWSSYLEMLISHFTFYHHVQLDFLTKWILGLVGEGWTSAEFHITFREHKNECWWWTCTLGVVRCCGKQRTISRRQKKYHFRHSTHHLKLPFWQHYPAQNFHCVHKGWKN